MTQRIKMGTLTVEVFFNEYDKNLKTRKQIPGHEITRQDRLAIDRGLDNTDFGEFYRFEDKDKEITGMFNVIDNTDNDDE
jgi:hypothetical protein